MRDVLVLYVVHTRHAANELLQVFGEYFVTCEISFFTRSLENLSSVKIDPVAVIHDVRACMSFYPYFMCFLVDFDELHTDPHVTGVE